MAVRVEIEGEVSTPEVGFVLYQKLRRRRCSRRSVEECRGADVPLHPGQERICIRECARRVIYPNRCGLRWRHAVLVEVVVEAEYVGKSNLGVKPG